MKRYAIKCADTYSVLNEQSKKRKYWKNKTKIRIQGNGSAQKQNRCPHKNTEI